MNIQTEQMYYARAKARGGWGGNRPSCYDMGPFHHQTNDNQCIINWHPRLAGLTEHRNEFGEDARMML